MDKGSVRFWLVVKQGFMVRLCIAAADPDGICGPITAFKMITVYRYKLNVHTQPDAMFYKDEGGKNKCMTIEVGMEDVLADRLPMHQQDLSKALVVPFTTTLIYEDGNAPYQQEILTLSQDSDRQVTTAKSATVRFRIEEAQQQQLGAHSMEVAEQEGQLTHHRSTAKARITNREDAPQACLVAEHLGMQREVSDAVKSLTEWIKEALAALHELQWELVGYEVGKDGKPDTKWPMYRCPSCKQFKDPANNSTTHRTSGS
ncbi:hypothetical protein JKP88DRAFT_347719 [Tribonema minus]|uniref:Uncharacterized protein n=1 Tax=Tribonema minus TaxID=303371 RepID=A0A836CKS5_9STRA|nr:hypothetical protein JKP88DRAFT_347719 [Tribonema minus]